MSEDLRKTMLHSAASRYGAEHYRGILFAHHFRRLAPALGLVAFIGVVGWLLAPAAEFASGHANVAGAVIVGALVVLGLLALVVRRLRSPYRRRRFR